MTNITKICDTCGKDFKNLNTLTMEKFFDSEGTEIKDNDILLSSGNPYSPVEYRFHCAPGNIPQVQLLWDFSGIYTFEYFKKIRPRFIKKQHENKK